MKKLLVVDGNSILNRAYYGIRPLTTKTGLHTNAVYGMTTMLTKQLSALSPDYAVIAFDRKEPTFRHEMYAEYKANRTGMPEELAEQLPYAKRCVELLGFHVIELPGYEADDVLGTVAAMCADEKDTLCHVFTGDRDSLQLIGPSTVVLLATNTETVRYDGARFTEEYGVSPEEFVDVKALMGDSSDNIPGVAGIGKVSALKLIASFSSLEGVYEHLDDPSIKPGARAKLESGREMAFLSRDLARICKAAPIEKTLDDMHYEGIEKDGLAALFTELEFSALIEKMGLHPVSAPSVEGTEEAVATAPAEVRDAAIADVPTDRTLAVLCDGETVLFSDGAVTYRVLNTEELFPALRKMKLVTHDAKGFLHAIRYAGATPAFVFDTMLAAYLLSAGENHYELERVALKYLASEAGEVAEQRLATVLRLYPILRREILEKEQGRVYYDIELPLATVLYEMECAGFAVNRDGIVSYGVQLAEAEAALCTAIYEEAGESFNLNSPKQLGEILFGKLGIPGGKKTKSGYSTAAEVLEKLRPMHPIVDNILSYRQISKLRSTYADGLLKVIAEDGKIHTSFNQCVTATGRLSSTEPNLQNIPVRTHLGRELRKYFIASSDEYVLIDADYSQIELRLLAHVSKDEAMTESFLTGDDIHASTAAEVFGVPRNEVTPELRAQAKAVNFGIVYGIGEFSLAEDLGISRREAADYIAGYLAAYPEVDAYLKRSVADATVLGYAKTMYGRIRHIPELSAKNMHLRAFGERVAMNSPIQGAAADIMKIAMINVRDALLKAGIDARLIMQVHDELIVESHTSCAEEAAAILRREMENAAALSVPLIAETASGPTWFACKG